MCKAEDTQHAFVKDTLLPTADKCVAFHKARSCKVYTRTLPLTRSKEHNYDRKNVFVYSKGGRGLS